MCDKYDRILPLSQISSYVALYLLYFHFQKHKNLNELPSLFYILYQIHIYFKFWQKQNLLKAHKVVQSNQPYIFLKVQ